MESPEDAPAFRAPEPQPGPDRSRTRSGRIVVTLASIALMGGVLMLTPLLPRPAPWSSALARRLPAPLEAYPDSEALGAVAGPQLQNRGLGPGRALARVSRSGNGRTTWWEEWAVFPSGESQSWRELWDHATQGGVPRRPAATFRRKAAQALVDRLPPSLPHPPLARVLIVSFERDGRWTTRLYDQTEPPSVLIELEALATGRSAESRKSLWMVPRDRRAPVR